MARPLDLDELLEHFTLADDELELLRNKSGATRLGFSLLLKYLGSHEQRNRIERQRVADARLTSCGQHAEGGELAIALRDLVTARSYG